MVKAGAACLRQCEWRPLRLRAWSGPAHDSGLLNDPTCLMLTCTGEGLQDVTAVGLNQLRCRAGIKAIKLYAWEEPFKKRIEALRAAELHEIRYVKAKLRNSASRSRCVRSSVLTHTEKCARGGAYLACLMAPNASHHASRIHSIWLDILRTI